MSSLIVYLCIASFILLAGMFGEKEEKGKAGFMYAFCTCILVIAAIAITMIKY